MNRKMKILMGIALSAFLVTGCDGLFTEDCIYKGYVHARNEFHHPSDMGTPEQSEMNLLVYPLSGAGIAEYENLCVPFDTAGNAREMLHIGEYGFLAYNKDVNILELGTGMDDALLRVPTDKGMITQEQGYTYSSWVSGTVMTDDTLHITCPSRLMVQKVMFNITVTNAPDILEYKAISAELDGVATSRYLRSRRKGNGFATLPFTLLPEKKNFFRKEILVFGINSGASNLIRLSLKGNMPVDTELDLSEIFKDFTADGISVDINVRISPSLQTATATIEGWQDMEWGDGIVTY